MIDASREERRLAVQGPFFAAFAVVVAGVALWLVLSTIGGTPGTEPTLSAPVRYTVKVGQIQPSRRRAVEQTSYYAELNSVAGRHEVFWHRSQEGALALCVGRFASRGSTEAQGLLQRLKESNVQAFESARLWAYRPAEPP